MATRSRESRAGRQAPQASGPVQKWRKTWVVIDPANNLRAYKWGKVASDAVEPRPHHNIRGSKRCAAPLALLPGFFLLLLLGSFNLFCSLAPLASLLDGHDC
eukprot:SAG22_NODE_3803_length_1525_cov_3.108696_2_plen_102_part_00